MNTTTIQKWGNSYAVRLPKATVRALNLRAGNPVKIQPTDHGDAFSIVLIHHRAISFKDMVSRITERNTHRAADWGRAKEKEAW